MSVSIMLSEGKITSKPTLGFEFTISKKNHFYGPRDLITQPCNLWHSSKDKFNPYFKRRGICSQLVALKVLNNSVHLVPCFLENSQINKSKNYYRMFSSGDNSHRLGYRMCRFLRVLFWLKNKFLGLFYSF